MKIFDENLQTYKLNSGAQISSIFFLKNINLDLKQYKQFFEALKFS